MTHEFCKSHYLSQFATFFIDVGAKTSPATGCISQLCRSDQLILFQVKLPFTCRGVILGRTSTLSRKKVTKSSHLHCHSSDCLRVKYTLENTLLPLYDKATINDVCSTSPLLLYCITLTHTYMAQIPSSRTTSLQGR